jgi:hypothetical protein
MLDIVRRIGHSRRQPRVRGAAPAGRLTLERLEGRDLPAPLAPTGLVATGISTSAIALTWDASPDHSSNTASASGKRCSTSGAKGVDSIGAFPGG